MDHLGGRPHHRRIKWGRIISGTVGYAVFLVIVRHFLSIAKSEDHVLDGIRAGAGMIALQVGIGKESIIKTLDAFSRFLQAFPSWWRAKTQTTEHPIVPLFPEPRSPIPVAKPKRHRPPKGSIAHRSTARGKPKPKK